MFSAGRDGLMEWLGFHAYLEDLLDLNPSGTVYRYKELIIDDDIKNWLSLAYLFVINTTNI